MSTPQEPILSCYMEVLRQALIYGRAMARSEKPYEQIADLMDAVHVIPELVYHWEQYGKTGLMPYLTAYDKKWARGETDFSLVRTFETVYQSKAFPPKLVK